MKPGATIINTASVEAHRPKSSLLAYAATNGAIVNFTKGFSQEAIQKGIRVNAWRPVLCGRL